MAAKKESGKGKDSLLSKIGGTIGGLVFVGLGVYVMVDPTAFHPAAGEEARRAKTRLFSNTVKWLMDNVGAIPSGILLMAIGALIVWASWMKLKESTPNGESAA